ncbi:MAG: YheU family protein [Desulfuromonadales bacterium]|nr:YheU family protein [Desulfuromonadales bacterium]
MTKNNQKQPQGNPTDHHEKGVDVPYDRLDPETLRRLIQEFVTRDGFDWGETGGTLEDKVREVLHQLRSKQVKVVFDLTSQTANIVVCR